MILFFIIPTVNITKRTWHVLIFFSVNFTIPQTILTNKKPVTIFAKKLDGKCFTGAPDTPPEYFFEHYHLCEKNKIIICKNFHNIIDMYKLTHYSPMWLIYTP